MNKKDKKKQTKIPPQKNRLRTVLLIIVALATILLLARVISIQYLKHEFGKIEQDIRTLQLELAKTNPEMKTEINKYCQQNREKFGGGAWNCGISLKSQNSIDSVAVDDWVKNNMVAINKVYYHSYEGLNKLSVSYFASKQSGNDCKLEYREDYNNSLVSNDTIRFIFTCSKQVNHTLYQRI